MQNGAEPYVDLTTAGKHLSEAGGKLADALMEDKELMEFTVKLKKGKQVRADDALRWLLAAQDHLNEQEERKRSKQN
jgi:hypothetical protein